MKDNYKRLFEKINQFEPSEKLQDGILAKIDLEKRRSAGIRLIFFGIVATFLFVAVVPSSQYVAREFYQSGFYQYFSFIFSDSGAVLSSWKEFTLLLAESAPLTEITIFLATILAFLVSVKLAIKNVCVRKLKLI